MTESVYCGSCGGEIAATAKFCKHCGADQSRFREVEEPPAHTPAAPPPPQPARTGREQAVAVGERAEQVAPGATELAERLATQLRTPGVAMAGLAGLAGAAACLAVGLLVAVVLPHGSFVSIGGSGLVTETLLQAAAFSQANLELTVSGESVRTVPVLFVLVPILGVAAGTALLAPRTAGMPATERLLWGAAAAVPFALLMLIVALSAGKAEFDLFGSEVKASAGAVFLLSLVWGALGGALGVAHALRRASEPLPSPLPPSAARFAGLAWTALRPLGLALAIAAVLGALLWVPWVAADSDYRDFPERSAPVAMGEQLLYSGDRAVELVSLGAGASVRLSIYPALPIDPERLGDLVGELSGDSDPSYGVFGFADTMPAYLFVPALIVLIAVPALLALYAGFAVVRRLGETRLERAAAWGAIVGPLWAVAMALLAALVRKDVVGDPTGESLFVAFLLGGAVLGALGGVLAVQGSTPAPLARAPVPPGQGPRRFG